MKKKVCMLTTHHSALDDRIFYKEARSLYNAGYDVTLIAPLNKDGFLTDMGRKPIAKEEALIDGIKIIGFREGKHSLFGLPKTWTISQWIRLSKNVKSNYNNHDPFADIISRGLEIEADVYHCHEIWSLYSGIKIKNELEKRGKKCKLIYDVHEFWSAKNSKKRKDLIWSIVKKNFEQRSLNYVDYIITINQILRGYFLYINRFIKTEILYNCSIQSIYDEDKKSYDDNIVTVTHEGVLTFERGLKEILEVIKILKERHSNKFKFLIIGDIYNEEKAYFDNKVKEYQISDNISETGWLPYNEVNEAISKCLIGIIFMDPSFSENISFSSPNKLFNYMKSGLSIVAVDLPEIRRIIVDANCGIIVKERTTEALADALSTLIDNPELRQKLGQNGRKAVEEKYNWGVMEKRLLRVYDELLSSSKFVL